MAPPHANLQFSKNGPAALVLDACEKMHEADKRAERNKKRWGTIAIVSGIGAMVGLFVGAGAESPLVLGLAGLSFVLTIVSLILRSVLGSSDVDDRKLDVVRGLVKHLRPELKARRPLRVRLDFRGYDRTRPLGNTTKWYRATGSKVFKRQWLTMNFVLLDGTTVHLEASSTCKRKQKAKRKYVKLKDKVVDELVIKYRPAKGRVLDPNKQSAVEAGVPKSQALSLVSCKIRPRVAQFVLRTRPGMRTRLRSGWVQNNLKALLDGRKVLGGVIGSYRALTRA